MGLLDFLFSTPKVSVVQTATQQQDINFSPTTEVDVDVTVSTQALADIFADILPKLSDLTEIEQQRLRLEATTLITDYTIQEEQRVTALNELEARDKRIGVVIVLGLILGLGSLITSVKS